VARCSDGTYNVKVLKQCIMVDGVRYNLQEIYGIDQSTDTESGRECVICMSELCDTTVLPCRHMCLCGGCADILRFQSSKCPICRTTVKSLLQIKKPENKTDVKDDQKVQEDKDKTAKDTKRTKMHSFISK